MSTDTKVMIGTVLAILVGSFCVVFLVAERRELEVRKTSPNTWVVYDPDYHPEEHVGRTCPTEGREIANIIEDEDSGRVVSVVCR